MEGSEPRTGVETADTGLLCGVVNRPGTVTECAEWSVCPDEETRVTKDVWARVADDVASAWAWRLGTAALAAEG